MSSNIDKTVAITGAGNGLGAVYAKYLASKGLNVLVNNRTHLNKENSADLMVNEIKASGGSAVANYSSIEDIKNIKEKKKIYGVVVGKAIYEGLINLNDLVKLNA